MDAPVVRAQFPPKFKPLLESTARYKIFHGGRGGAKSWQFARALLVRGMKGGLRVLCTRETQSSLRESSKQLLTDQIKLLGLDAYYRVLESEIRGPDGTLFMFKGMADPDAIKSLEGADVVWGEEASSITEGTWKKLDPTVRKPGAEIWLSFNPDLETGWIYSLFVKGKPPPDSIVVKVTYRDNPWLDIGVRRQIEHMKATDYDEYLWVWEGFPRVSLEGAVYARELRAAQAEDRITYVPIEPSKPVHTFWDLGRGDQTAIWFVQIVGFQYRILHYYEANGFLIDHYISQLETIRKERGFFYGTHWLPHDADNKLLGMRRTIRQQVEDAGHRVKIVGKAPVHEGINAARTLFPNCYFDEEHTEAGLKCLRSYHYDVADDGTRSKNPTHDWSSHGADGFRYMGVALKEDVPKVRQKPRERVRSGGQLAWMGR